MMIDCWNISERMFNNSDGLVSVKCYIRDDTDDDDDDDDDDADTHDDDTNPFSAGGAVSEDGELIIRLWRNGRLGDYNSRLTNTDLVTTKISFKLN